MQIVYFKDVTGSQGEESVHKKKYLFEKIWLYVLFLALLILNKGSKKYVFAWKNLALWTTYFWFHVYLNQSWPLFDFYDKVFTSNLPSNLSSALQKSSLY